MIRTLVVTLGKLGDSLIETTERIIGRSDTVEAVSLEWDEDLASFRQRLVNRITALSDAGGILLLTDMFGSTATNVSLEQLEKGRVEVVTGVNLPMVIKALTLSKGTTLTEAANTLRTQGRKAIYIASEML